MCSSRPGLSLPSPSVMPASVFCSNTCPSLLATILVPFLKMRDSPNIKKARSSIWQAARPANSPDAVLMRRLTCQLSSLFSKPGWMSLRCICWVLLARCQAKSAAKRSVSCKLSLPPGSLSKTSPRAFSTVKPGQMRDEARGMPDAAAAAGPLPDSWFDAANKSS